MGKLSSLLFVSMPGSTVYGAQKMIFFLPLFISSFSTSFLTIETFFVILIPNYLRFSFLCSHVFLDCFELFLSIPAC